MSKDPATELQVRLAMHGAAKKRKTTGLSIAGMAPPPLHSRL